MNALAAPFTINTMPDATLLAFADHGTLGEMMPDDGGDAEATLAKFTQAGINHDQLADDLQREGAEHSSNRGPSYSQLSVRKPGSKLSATFIEGDVYHNLVTGFRSKDGVLQMRAYLRDIFAEAVDQDFLMKELARKVKVPT